MDHHRSWKFDPPFGTVTFTTDMAGFTSNSTWTSYLSCSILAQIWLLLLIINFAGPNLEFGEGGTPSWVSNSSGENTITEAENINDKQFGNQAATLEMFALRLPFLLIPNQLCKCHICIFTDKMPCVFGMKERLCEKGRRCSDRAAYMIGGYLGSVVHTIHSPCRSLWEAITANNLSQDKQHHFLKIKYWAYSRTLSCKN